MRKGNYTNTIYKYADVVQACDYYKLGRSKLMDVATKLGAVRRLGGKVLIDIEVMDEGIKKM